MSALRQRQMAAVRENEELTRRIDAEDEARRASRLREREGKIAGAHRRAKTKQSQATTRHAFTGRKGR